MSSKVLKTVAIFVVTRLHLVNAPLQVRVIRILKSHAKKPMEILDCKLQR